MYITDLVECELVKFDVQIFGGAEAYTITNTYTSKGFAYGESGALAFGDATTTQAKVFTNTYKRNNSFSSYSFANAQAKAQDNNDFASSNSISSSVLAYNS